jgi:hypothetical protein
MVTPTELAEAVGISPKTLRAALRHRFPRDPAFKGTNWDLALPHIEWAFRRWNWH